MTREVINPNGVPDTTELGFNQLIVEDGNLYMSGQVGWDEDFEVVGGDLKSQAHKAFENLETVLESLDKDLEDVTKIRTYIVDPYERYEDYREVWAEVWGDGPYPCHAVLGVEQLAREELIVELEAEAPL
jgi:enamine deaminase RidA (YjgF/YER057c/UK114 family)